VIFASLYQGKEENMFALTFSLSIREAQRFHPPIAFLPPPIIFVRSKVSPP
jgi:hypothetical protein